MLLWISIAVATLLATAAVVWPLLAPRAPAGADPAADERRRLAVYRDRKRELESEQAAGRLSDDDAAQAQADLLRQVAQEVPAADGDAPAASTGGDSASRVSPRLVALALAVLVPLVALGVYRQVGAPQLVGVDLTRAAPPLDEAGIQRMIADIEQRTRDEPGNGEAWAMLAETRRIQGRHADAVAAYEKAVSLLPPDARILADFAESVALVADGDFAGRPVALLEQALKLDPDEPRAIALMGAAQYRLGRLPEARDLLKRLLATLPAGSDDAAEIGEVLARIESEIAQRGPRPAPGAPKGAQ